VRAPRTVEAEIKALEEEIAKEQSARAKNWVPSLISVEVS
jgi:hypothetical protein